MAGRAPTAASRRFDDQPVAGIPDKARLGGKRFDSAIMTLDEGCRWRAIAAALRADPGLMPKFIEESLRLEPPINACIRWASRETEIAGVAIPAFSCVHVRIPGKDVVTSAQGESFYVVEDGTRKEH